MLADRYPDDEERGKAMGTALGGLALGVLGKYFHKFILLNIVYFSWSTIWRIYVSICEQSIAIFSLSSIRFF